MLCFDCTNKITRVIPQLLAIDQEIRAIRYMAPGGANAWKTFDDTELRAIKATGGKIKLGPVFETNGRPRGASVGRDNGQYALETYKHIGAPKTGVWNAYTSDEDEPSAMSALAAAVEAYFGTMKDGGYQCNRVMYAAGATCDYLKAAGLIDTAWLTQSMGFAGTRHDIEVGRWDVDQKLDKSIVGLDADPDVFRDTNKDYGFFIPDIAAPGLPDSVLPHEASAPDVEALQAALNAKDNAHLTVDGDYGPATTTEVENFQRAHGLAVDGLAGPTTIAALKAA